MSAQNRAQIPDVIDDSDLNDASLLAFDLGGTRLKAGVVVNHRVRRFEFVTLGGRDPLDEVVALGRRLVGEGAIDSIGLCLPGLVDGGRVDQLPGKLEGIVGRDIGGMLERELGRRPLVVNDAIAHALGEARFGAGRGFSRVAVLTIGTGVGVGVVEGGRPLGAGPCGGGILGGQIPIAGWSRWVDSSGHRGTIEALCSAARILDLAGGRYSSVPEVLVASGRREPDALAALARYRRDLVRALIALAHAHSPDAIVVGGGPITADGAVLAGVEEAVGRRLFAGYSVAVRRTELGDHAALLGLAALVDGPARGSSRGAAGTP